MINADVVFVDTVYLIALNVPADNWRRAAEQARDALEPRTRLVIHDGVILECLARLSRAPQESRRQFAEQFGSLRGDPAYEVVPHTAQLMDEALRLFGHEFANSNLSLQDCINIAIMRQREISTILSFDEAFGRAGFTPLLRRYLP